MPTATWLQQSTSLFIGVSMLFDTILDMRATSRTDRQDSCQYAGQLPVDAVDFIQ
ncbi:MAG: hypothetical protein ACLVLH_21985 [Eisenbergiella massiliensis]